MEIIQVTSKEHLRSLILEHTDAYGYGCDLNHLDVSRVVSMSYLFSGSCFHGDISKWDTSGVMDMQYMFKDSSFNGDISEWNVSKVRSMDRMFFCSPFNGDLSKWDVSNVERMQFMFQDSPFQGTVASWNLSSLEFDDYILPTFRHSPLGYLGVIKGEYPLPDDSDDTLFKETRSLCEGLGLKGTQAASYIYQRMMEISLNYGVLSTMDSDINFNVV